MLSSGDGQYVTIDYWRSRGDFDKFKAKSSAAYADLDARCDALTQLEERIGQFSVHTRPS